MMKLDEKLRFCLLAVANRYPGCLVEINQAVLDRTGLWEEICPAEQALQRLQNLAPQLLEAQARLLIDDRQAQSAIYLLDRSEEFPAFQLYCGEDHGEQLGRHMLHEPCLVLKEVD
jgi:hypothetical protein